MIDKDLNVLQEYKDQQKHYDGHDYAHCPNFVKSYSELYIENGVLKFVIDYVLAKLNTMKNV